MLEVLRFVCRKKKTRKHCKHFEEKKKTNQETDQPVTWVGCHCFSAIAKAKKKKRSSEGMFKHVTTGATQYCGAPRLLNLSLYKVASACMFGLREKKHTHIRQASFCYAVCLRILHKEWHRERNRDLLREWRVYERFLCVHFNAVIRTTINSCRSTAAYIAALTLEIEMRVRLIFFFRVRG